MALSPGIRLGVYEITAQIGVGGMGEVYRATDSNLKRSVAIKVLPASVAGDADRLSRFQREAQVLAALNHPNIAAIYGLERTAEFTALVMELVEGDDLSQRIARGAIPISEALPIAKQIGDALEAAHERGIIHRDLKPANIKVRADGTVKVLDFGLAKAMEPTGEPAVNASMSPSITTPAMTQAGMILGTAAYMSPEQARGQSADKRSDVWAFGCVLYEVLTGLRAFAGQDVAETLAAVIRADPDWSALPAATPPAIAKLLRRCLAKDRSRRLADIADARLEIVENESAPTTPEPTSRERLAFLPWAIAVLMTAVAGVALVLPHESAATAHVTRFTVAAPATHDVYTGGGAQPALSPDGRTLVYIGLLADGGRRLFRRALDQLDATPIPGTEGDVTHPFFSPDGQWLGFFANSSLRKIRLSGGTAEKLADHSGRGGSWLSDNTLVFADLPSGSAAIGARLFRVPMAGGEAIPIGEAQGPGGKDGQVEGGQFYPQLLSNGDVLAFTLWTGSLDSARVAVRSLATGEERVLMAGTNPRLLPTGHLLFARQDSIWATRFDPTRLQAIGDPVRVMESVQVNGGGLALFDVSPTGTLVYVPGIAAGGQRTLVWVDRRGREEPLTAPPRRYRSVRLAPDGLRVATEIRGTDGRGDIYVWDGSRAALVRFTSDPADDSNPIWTRDGRRLVFASARAGRLTAFWQAADGTGKPERILASDDVVIPYALTPDDANVAVLRSAPKAPSGLSLVSMIPGRLDEPLMSAAGRLDGFAISSDGRWLAYQSDESGQSEVYVRPFPRVNDGRWVISRNGGISPVWSKQGDELFYFSSDGQLMSAAIRSQPGFSVGEVKSILANRYLAAAGTYDVSPDGQRFLVIKDAGAQIVVVENWFEELKAKVPAAK